MASSTSYTKNIVHQQIASVDKQIKKLAADRVGAETFAKLNACKIRKAQLEQLLLTIK